MNPNIKGYFVYGRQYALITDIQVHTLLGLRNRYYVNFRIALWDSAQYSGQPNYLTSPAGASQWCVELDGGLLSAEQVESYCIQKTLNTMLTSNYREPAVRLRSRTVTLTLPDRGETEVRITPIRLTETLVRDLESFELHRGDTALLYRAVVGESKYEFTLYYNSNLDKFASIDLTTGPLLTHCELDLAKRTLT